MLDLQLGTVSESEFIAGMSENDESYEDKGREHYRYHGQALFLRHGVALPSDYSGKARFGGVPHLIVYGTPKF